jgi:predicted Rossmann fold nucleotide-binding protein DprA/Smf involved in DNA uptake
LKIMVGTSGEIFVIPQQNGAGNSVNNWLIKQGAKLAENPIDILNEF